MNTNTCWWFSHEWSKWEMTTVMVKILWKKDEEPFVRQIRRCEKCGLTQIRRV